MQNMDNDAARVIRDITKTPIYVPEGKGEINVCEAVKDMINESRLEGRAEGKAEGKIQMLKELVKDGTLSVVSAAAKVNSRGLDRDCYLLPQAEYPPSD